ncbi:MAG: phospholipase D-like domain-containing protein [Planctomycetaceae bacterium]|jgi:superfamily II DNA/RNA helicase|nr:phospholipase D-like domain-containing protein [Planctomycetaceae bacterium]
MSNSTIIDNYLHGTVQEFLEDSITADSNISIVSAYFTIYAYQKLKKRLDSIGRLRFLFGEPTFVSNIDPDKINFRDFKIEDETQSIVWSNRLVQKSLAQECANWLSEKAEIRSMVKPNFLHGKLYHIIQPNGVEKAIAGSSNFTVNGLGCGGNKNIELNLIIDSDRERRELGEWFDKIWNDKSGIVEDVKGKVIEYLKVFYRENDPEFVYFKTLCHVFDQFLSEQEQGGLLDEKTGFYDSQIWNILYDFQKDGVKGAINKIQKHGGCIIADSVGLGKTFEALAVIKYFELLNARVLVICPKKLSANWTIYQSIKNNILNPFVKDRFNFSVIWHTDVGRDGIAQANNINLNTFNWGAYDLVVIDESHNFRGNPVEKQIDAETIKLNRTKWLLDKIIKSGVRTKVLMLSATPVNNTLRDLRNQIAFITGGNDFMLQESCGIKNISTTLSVAQRHFTQWADPKNQKRHIKELLETIDPSFFRLLDELTIARSRKHVRNFYNSETENTTERFPERLKPKSLYPNIDSHNNFPSYENIEQTIRDYKLTIFNPSAYVQTPHIEKYENLASIADRRFTQKQRETVLVEMIKVNFLKRLESSIKSFADSLQRTIDKINKLENQIDSYFKLNKPKIEFETKTPDDDEVDEDSGDDPVWQVGKKLKFDFEHLDLERWRDDLQSDRKTLENLLSNAQSVTPERDEKLRQLKSIIREKISNPINNNNKKILIFTAFADTAFYLYDNLCEWSQEELGLICALVCGTETRTKLGKNSYDEILTNFSPQSKNRNKINEQRGINERQEIDILIATDCISEGQNLQDCDFLINYDIHWNPVKIIQRFGRIDRLGSINEKIQLVNFWPTKDLDKYINLKGRVESRMALVDLTATGEDNILSNDQIEEIITAELKYRTKQLKKLRDEVLDIEEIDDAISLTDFTLDDFRMDLLNNFIDKNKKQLINAPLGLYAIVPTPNSKLTQLNQETIFSDKELSVIKPGVIFCLAQKNSSHDNNTVNPLNSFFLVYVYDDGKVQYNFTNAKTILEIFRKLCQNKKTPYEDLCSLFNAETEKGTKMKKYNYLLANAIDAIKNTFGVKNIQQLTTSRNAVLIPELQKTNSTQNFDLVTWLIIK